MSEATEQANRLLLRARDTMDRDYAQPLDVPALARVALMSEAHFIREFGAAYGIDCGIRDPFGNHLRFSQPNPDMKVPTAEELKNESWS